MIFKRMREQILDKAIRGQLLPQLQEEGVVEQIGDAPSEVPFDIPSSWKWVYLKTIVCPTQQKVPDKDFTYIDVSCIASFLVDQPKLLSADKAPSRARKIVHPGMILYATVRPYLKNICIAPEIQGDVIASTAFATFECKKSISNRYLFYVLISDYMSSYAKSVQKGISYPAINDNDFYKTLIPLPPLAEQKRIAAKIESLFSEINRAEKAYEELQSLANVLRCQILQKAIQGKLVPQLHDDGVVEQIGDLPAELPFEIPDSWKWGLLENYVTINPSASKLDDNTEVSFLPMASVHPGFVNNFDREESKLWANAKKGFSKFANGDVLIAKISPCFENRKSCIVRDLINGFGAGSTELITMRPTDLIYAEYLLWYVKTKYVIDYCSSTFKGTVGQQRINPDRFKSMPIPVPPLAEQKRIVAKIEALFEQIDLMTK